MKKKILYEKYREQQTPASPAGNDGRKIQEICQIFRNVWDDVVFIVIRILLVLLISFVATILLNKPLRDMVLDFLVNAV